MMNYLIEILNGLEVNTNRGERYQNCFLLNKLNLPHITDLLVFNKVLKIF